MTWIQFASRAGSDELCFTRRLRIVKFGLLRALLPSFPRDGNPLKQALICRLRFTEWWFVEDSE